ncbi:hypothetical protein XAC3810_240170 [Xanthomonas citri pv. citri]|nr:hypothetical protein XAC3810_240170 [Xanthomonas citri pv. citri]
MLPDDEQALATPGSLARFALAMAAIVPLPAGPPA